MDIDVDDEVLPNIEVYQEIESSIPIQVTDEDIGTLHRENIAP